MQSAATGGGVYPAGPGSGAMTTVTSGSRARDLGLRAQKKLLGRFAASNAGRSLLIDDATTSLLDNLYKLMERAARKSQQLDKKQPEKVLKNIVKLSIKVRDVSHINIRRVYTYNLWEPNSAGTFGNCSFWYTYTYKIKMSHFYFVAERNVL